jgi:hypothetical protein
MPRTRSSAIIAATETAQVREPPPRSGNIAALAEEGAYTEAKTMAEVLVNDARGEVHADGADAVKEARGEGHAEGDDEATPGDDVATTPAVKLVGQHAGAATPATADLQKKMKSDATFARTRSSCGSALPS